ncbi:hypothetical protein [Clostridium kluyveri]|uniref:Uncharacterized protein n=1 Tax=Clostridium kluyveri (strain ATCC 8527 / DSM 555 / NBRC 12016 / NCIMB 10680 / K1) TaxID=431943 RepID=A5MZV7_CLOK5|nr:hypothetical protein [Clostridium kluyveri]EDK34403.1 Hypothetical protein CKL_2391 [Clostridium kluyveri DSM 555]
MEKVTFEKTGTITPQESSGISLGIYTNPPTSVGCGIGTLCSGIFAMISVATVVAVVKC